MVPKWANAKNIMRANNRLRRFYLAANMAITGAPMTTPKA